MIKNKTVSITSSNRKRKCCEDCAFWKEDNGCTLYSCNCATAVLRHLPLTGFLPRSDVDATATTVIAPNRHNGGNDDDKMEEVTPQQRTGIFMNEKELASAKANRNRYHPLHPNMSQLTDESKKEMRSLKRKLNKIDRIV